MLINTSIKPFYDDKDAAGSNGTADTAVAEGEQHPDGSNVMLTSDEKKVAEAAAPELDIEGLEKTDDGYEYTEGNSIYKGETIKEVLSKARRGREEKDKHSLELDRALREERAKKAIRSPREDEEDDELEIKQPSQNEIVNSVFQGSGLNPDMIGWSDQQWLSWGDEQGLREFQLNRMMQRVEKFKDDATKRMNEQTAVWLNRTTLKSDLTPAVQDMVAEAGVDPEEFGPIYLSVLKDKQYTDPSGLLNTAKILRAMHREILKVVKPVREAAVTAKAKEEKAKLEEKKNALGSSGRTTVSTKVSQKQPVDIKEASRMALKLAGL